MKNPPRYAGVVLLAPLPAWAATGPLAGMATLFASLALLLGGFVALAWAVHRYLPGRGREGAAKVLGATAVGARERVVVVEVADTWLVLGVGGGNVHLLHRLPKPDPVPPQ